MRSQAAELGLHHADAFGEPRTSERLIIRFTPLILKPADTSGKSLQSALHIRGVQSVGSLLFEGLSSLLSLHFFCQKSRREVRTVATLGPASVMQRRKQTLEKSRGRTPVGLAWVMCLDQASGRGDWSSSVVP